MEWLFILIAVVDAQIHVCAKLCRIALSKKSNLLYTNFKNMLEIISNVLY